ncbi:type IV pilin N-terminal domain-containing protein [Halobacteria archaeon AArc-dxtr1]|nr:type IV pilin N-terminal domain-containing protein [Halobacteria archaeon AArc-dxtr1]
MQAEPESSESSRTPSDEQPSTDHRAVSPVLGVVLMVAITVVLAAVIGAFVLDIEPADSTVPNANFDWIEDENGSVTIIHDGGQAFDASRMSLSGEPVGDDLELEGVDSGSWGPETTAGDRITVSDDSLPESGELVLRYDTGGGISIIDDFTYANRSAET